jgi:ferredoxin
MGKNLSMIQLMELDACTHCAMCTSRCSVAIAFEGVSNINILPSEKIASIKALASGRPLKEREIKDIQEADAIKLSLDGPAGVNDLARGEGVHDKVIEAIRICKEYNMDVNLTTVISRYNAGSLDYILAVAAKYNVGVYLNPRIRITAAEAKPAPGSE